MLEQWKKVCLLLRSRHLMVIVLAVLCLFTFGIVLRHKIMAAQASQPQEA